MTKPFLSLDVQSFHARRLICTLQRPSRREYYSSKNGQNKGIPRQSAPPLSTTMADTTNMTTILCQQHNWLPTGNETRSLLTISESGSRLSPPVGDGHRLPRTMQDSSRTIIYQAGQWNLDGRPSTGKEIWQHLDLGMSSDEEDGEDNDNTGLYEEIIIDSIRSDPTDTVDIPLSPNTNTEARENINTDNQQAQKSNEQSETVTQTAPDAIPRFIELPNTQFNCHICIFECIKARELMEHMNLQHKANELVLRCKLCKLTFDKVHRLECHAPRCKGPPQQKTESSHPYQCDVCKERFKSLSGRSQHERHEHPAIANARRMRAPIEEAARKRERRAQALSNHLQARKMAGVWSDEATAALASFVMFDRGDKGKCKRAVDYLATRGFKGFTEKQISSKWCLKSFQMIINTIRAEEAEQETASAGFAAEPEQAENDNGIEGEDLESQNAPHPNRWKRSNLEGQTNVFVHEGDKLTRCIPEECNIELSRRAGEFLKTVPEKIRTDSGKEELIKESNEILEDLLAEFPSLEPEKSVKKVVEKKYRQVRRKKLRGKPKERRKLFRDIQREWTLNRKHATKKVLDGASGEKCQIDPKTVEETYSARFGKESKRVNLDSCPGPFVDTFPTNDSMRMNMMDPRSPSPPPSDSEHEAPQAGAGPFDRKPGCNAKTLLKWFTASEVRGAIRAMPTASAPGPDGITVRQLKEKKIKVYHYNILAGLFNVWYITGKVPPGLKRSRSILLPKGTENLDDLGNWRPLSIAGVIIRLYTKILAKRLTDSVTLHPSQRGFIRASGVDENTILLDRLIRTHKKRTKGTLVVAFLDLAKAFDTVSHDLIKKGLQRLDVPDQFIATVEDMYTGASTVFSTKAGDTAEISIKQGVKQGDPLSPILFNVAMDPLFCSLERDGEGWKESGRAMTALGYADDTAVLSDSREGMIKNLSIVEQYCRKVGLKLNVKKSYIFQIDCRGRTWTVNENERYVVDGDNIPWISPDNAVRYLGKSFGPWGGMTAPAIKVQIKTWSDRLRACGLKPTQKLEIWRSVIIPRIKSRILGTSPSKNCLNDLDREVKEQVKYTLKLHHTVSDGFLYAPTRKGGLGLTHLASHIPHQQYKIHRKMVGTLADQKVRSTYVKWWGLTLGIEIGFVGPEIVDHAKVWAEQKTQGAGSETWREHPESNWWIRNGPLSDNEFITACKLRTNTFPTRECLARTRTQGSVLCRRCGLTVETLGHISGACPAVKDARIKRHNSICKLIQDKMAKKGWTVLWEQKFRCPQGNLVPDLVCISPDESKAVIIDPTVVWETSLENLENAGKKKVEKYEPLRTKFKEGVEVEIYGLAVGARGGWHKSNDIALEALEMVKGELKRCRKAITLRALGGTVTLAKLFMDM